MEWPSCTCSRPLQNGNADRGVRCVQCQAGRERSCARKEKHVKWETTLWFVCSLHGRLLCTSPPLHKKCPLRCEAPPLPHGSAGSSPTVCVKTRSLSPMARAHVCDPSSTARNHITKGWSGSGAMLRLEGMVMGGGACTSIPACASVSEPSSH